MITKRTANRLSRLAESYGLVERVRVGTIIVGMLHYGCFEVVVRKQPILRFPSAKAVEIHLSMCATIYHDERLKAVGRKALAEAPDDAWQHAWSYDDRAATRRRPIEEEEA